MPQNILNSIKPNFKKIIFFILLFIGANLVAAFFLGVITALSANITVAGFNALSFDPIITIAYILLFYFITLFYQPSPRAQYYLFLYTLFLSFTVPFIQGAIFLVVFYFLLRKFKII